MQLATASSGPFTRHVLENPYPLGIGLILIGLVLGWLALREGRANRLVHAVVPLGLGLVALGIGAAVVTPGERGRAATLELVDRVVSEDVVGAMDLFADEATIHFGSASNVGQEHDEILRRLSRFTARYEIERNRVTDLKMATLDRDRAVVRLGCLTTSSTFHGPSVWEVEVERDDEGTWLVRRIVCISIGGQTPSSIP
jgi:hypothetical protein